MIFGQSVRVELRAPLQRQNSSLSGGNRVMQPKSRYWQSFDDHLWSSLVLTYAERTIQLCGLYQTTIYAKAVDAKLRRMQFAPRVEMAAEKCLAATCPKARQWFSTHVYIGVHVRRDDFTNKRPINFVVTIISPIHIPAIQYFIDRHQRVQCVIVSDDQRW